MFLKSTCALLVFAMVCAQQADAQKASGRSSAGSILPVSADTVAGTGSGKVRSLTFEFEFTEPSGNKFLDAKETGRLRLVINNIGKAPAKNVIAKVIPLATPTGVVFKDSILVGEIPVNSTRYAIFYFVASESVPSQILTFQLDVHDARGSSAEPRLLTFLTRALHANE